MKDIIFETKFTDTGEIVLENYSLLDLVRNYIDYRRPDFRKRPIEITIAGEKIEK